MATVSGSTATCTVEIPFSWTVNNPQGGAVLSYQIEAVSLTGSVPLTLRASSLPSLSQPYPSAGGTASASFNLNF